MDTARCYHSRHPLAYAIGAAVETCVFGIILVACCKFVLQRYQFLVSNKLIEPFEEDPWGDESDVNSSSRASTPRASRASRGSLPTTPRAMRSPSSGGGFNNNSFGYGTSGEEHGTVPLLPSSPGVGNNSFGSNRGMRGGKTGVSARDAGAAVTGNRGGGIKLPTSTASAVVDTDHLEWDVAPGQTQNGGGAGNMAPPLSNSSFEQQPQYYRPKDDSNRYKYQYCLEDRVIFFYFWIMVYCLSSMIVLTQSAISTTTTFCTAIQVGGLSVAVEVGFACMLYVIVAALLLMIHQMSDICGASNGLRRSQAERQRRNRTLWALVIFPTVLFAVLCMFHDSRIRFAGDVVDCVVAFGLGTFAGYLGVKIPGMIAPLAGNRTAFRVRLVCIVILVAFYIRTIFDFPQSYGQDKDDLIKIKIRDYILNQGDDNTEPTSLLIQQIINIFPVISCVVILRTIRKDRDIQG